MFRDTRDAPPGAELEADICIIGAGPAGITLARELAGSGARICVLESGGLEADDRTQSLADGRVVGDPYHALIRTRRRRFGGTAHAWIVDLLNGQTGFRSGPLDPIDFEQRDWLPHSGWPFDRAHLEPYYARAHRFCGFGRGGYGGSEWETPDARPLPLDERVVGTDVWQHAPATQFTRNHRDALDRAGDVEVWLHANVVELETNDTGTAVTRAAVACIDGPRIRVAARLFVLACGGLENARLLLLSDRVHARGLGNQHDLVGRFFMEHPYVRAATWRPSRPALYRELALYDVQRRGDAVTVGKLHLAEETQRRERLLGVGATIEARHRWFRRYRQESVNAFAALLGGATRGRLPTDAAGQLRLAIGGLDYVALAALRKITGRRIFPRFVPGPDVVEGGGWSRMTDAADRFDIFEITFHCEQAPHADNRVSLSDTRDILGCRATLLRWRWMESDIESAMRAERVLAREIERAGLGAVRPERTRGRPLMLQGGVYHHMGTTRMHDDPAQGVVDANCRVHGIANLYVAGSSVFPTGGYINPTLTIVALAMRLADHVKRVASRPPDITATSASA